MVLLLLQATPLLLLQAMVLLLLQAMVLLLLQATALLFLLETPLLLLQAKGCQLQHQIPVLWQTMRSQGRLQLAQSNSS